jgi:methionyl-tRNA formyltransferase
MKIGYFADGPWSHKAFELIVADRSIEIAFIVPRKDSTDTILNKYAKENYIDFLENVVVNSDEFYEQAKKYQCDLFVSMSYNQIFKSRIIHLPAMGTINCHAGKLPFYRGRNILNWALINDEKEFGITVHYIDGTIDTGDIILQRSFPITDEDNYSTLLLKAYDECAHILYDAIKILQTGSVKVIPQKSIHPIGSYFGMRTIGDELVNWNQTSRELFNFIRAICKPGPMAKTFCRGTEVFINKAALTDGAINYKCINGMIVGVTPRGYHVKSNDSLLEIYDIDSAIKLKLGDRLTCQP